ncbi:MAG: hypothetical protein ACOC9J_02205 [Persicimonas sp.]
MKPTHLDRILEAATSDCFWVPSHAQVVDGHGVYTAMLATRAAAAKRRGIDWLGLYARQETSAPIVAAQGFERHGHLHYFESECVTGEDV